jgi:predicted Na+-dependent transporter
MFKTLVSCILLPGSIYALTRRIRPIAAFSLNYGRLLTVFLVASGIFIVFAKKRDFILSHPDSIAIPFVFVLFFFVLAGLVGASVRAAPKDKIAYFTASSFNNLGLGIGLAFLYFDEKTIALMIAGQYAWTLLPLIGRPFLRGISKTL